MIVCQNCGHGGDQKFCPHCGEVLESKRISLPDVLSEVVNTFTSLERGFFYTIKQLALRPGLMQKRYLAGMRLHHQKPFPMFAISGTICALSLFFIYRGAPDSTDQYFYKNYYLLVQAGMLPVYAGVTYTLFYSCRLYYAEALVLNVYMVAFMSLLIIPVNTLSIVLNNGIISLMELILLISYSIWTYLNFFNDKGTWWVVVKSILSIAVCYLLFQYASRMVMAWVM